MTNQQISLFLFIYLFWNEAFFIFEKQPTNNPNQIFYIFSLTLTHIHQNFTPYYIYIYIYKHNVSALLNLFIYFQLHFNFAFAHFSSVRRNSVKWDRTKDCLHWPAAVTRRNSCRWNCLHLFFPFNPPSSIEPKIFHWKLARAWPWVPMFSISYPASISDHSLSVFLRFSFIGVFYWLYFLYAILLIKWFDKIICLHSGFV